MLIGFYPGSFDPITYGHLDIIARAAGLVDKLVVGIGTHGTKAALLPPQQRMALVKKVVVPVAAKVGAKVDCITFDGLTIDAAKSVKATVLIRGLRDATDFDYEVQMAQMNAAVASDVETVFLAASPATRMIASSLVKQIARMGGDITPFLPPEAQAAVKAAVAET